MKRKSELSKIRKKMEQNNQKRPPFLTLMPEDQWPPNQPPNIKEVWLSRYFLVQVFQENNDIIRLSVSRTMIGLDGHWEQNLSWDELMEVKRQVGHGNTYGVEVYPPEKDIVNVANMRHLWLLPVAVCGWRKGQ